MSKPLFSEEDYRKLREAEQLLADVQCTLARDNKPEEEWIELYRIRRKLGSEVYNRRPLNWTEVGPVGEPR